MEHKNALLRKVVDWHRADRRVQNYRLTTAEMFCRKQPTQTQFLYTWLCGFM